MRRYETKQSRLEKIKRQKRSNLIVMIAAVIIVMAMSLVVMVGRRSLIDKNIEYEARKQELQLQIEKQEARSQSLEEYAKYVKTKKYVEEVAKNKFGMLYPNEVIFRPENSK